MTKWLLLRNNVYLGKVSGGLSSASPTLAFLVPTWISILQEKKEKQLSKQRDRRGWLGGHCLKGQTRKWVIGCRESRCTSRHVMKAFLNANLCTPRVFLVWTWRGTKLRATGNVQISFHFQMYHMQTFENFWLMIILMLLKTLSKNF